MDPRRYARIREVFAEVDGLDLPARDRCLGELCADDPELRREVEDLLHASPAATTAIVRMADPFSPSSSPPPRGLPMLPYRLGPYEVARELGRGGMGVVYLATDTRLERRVALKLLPADLFATPSATASFEQEARLLAALDHANVATIFSLETIAPHTFYTLEFIDGEPLARRLERGPLSRPEILRLSHQLAKALTAAHARQIVHLDLKPGNLMLLPDGRLKVLDFGIARTYQQLAEVSGTGGFLAGTPGYMSPEQLRGDAVDARADLFAFGVILFQMASGTPPFGIASTAELIDRTLSAAPDWRQLPADLPESWRGLLERCLEKDPAQRCPDAVTLRRNIDALFSEELLPPVATGLDAETPNNLPLQLAEFVGRAEELSTLTDRLVPGTLLTLTGVGGGGKTRLALEVASKLRSSYPDGVVWIEVGSGEDPTRLDQALANALALPGGARRSTLLHFLSRRCLLVLIDNAEVALGTVRALVADILEAAPRVTILVTSREPLDHPRETTHAIQTLPLPAIVGDEAMTAERILASDAGRLFVTRARAHGFQATDDNAAVVARILRRLDGIPLALELAAGRLEVLSLEELEQRLADRFRLLGNARAASLPKRRTLAATLDWSHQLLDDDERRLFRRLALFADGWTLNAAERVCADAELDAWSILDLLASLVRKSLVTFSLDRDAVLGGRRYLFLETIREYALQKLEEDEPDLEASHTRLLEYYHELLEEAEPHFDDDQQPEWLARMDTEHANLRRALDHAKSRPDLAVIALEVANALWMYWDRRSDVQLGLEYLEHFLAMAPDAHEDRHRARALNAVGIFAQNLGDLAKSQAAFAEAIDICRRRESPYALGLALMNLAVLEKRIGHYDKARELYLEARRILEAQDRGSNLGKVLLNLGILENEQGHSERAHAYMREALEINERLDDPHALAAIHNTIGTLHRNEGQYDSARQHLTRSIEYYEHVGDHAGATVPMNNLALVHFSEGDYATTLELHQRALARREEYGLAYGCAISLVNLVPTSLRLGDLVAARHYFERLRTILLEGDYKRIVAYGLEGAAELVFGEGRPELGAQLEGAAEALRERLNLQLTEPDSVSRDRRRAIFIDHFGPARFAELLREGRELDDRDALAAC